MRVLFVCHRFPFPPNRGGKIRPFNILSHLAREHEVTVASLARSPAELEQGAGLGAHCHEVLVGRCYGFVPAVKMIGLLPTRRPSTMGYFHAGELHRRIHDAARRKAFDLIFVHCSSAAQYVADLQATIRVLDFGDMDSQKWLEYARWKAFPLNLGYRLEGRKMWRAERDLANSFDLCTTTTRAELNTLDSIGASATTAWFPNGVDSDYFKPSGTDYDPNLISFVGRMDYFPNQQCVTEFVRETLPIVRRSVPEARFAIIGAAPPPDIRKLAELPGVEVTGFVDDVRPHLERSAVNVAPLRIARGTQNKILEAMSLALPVVATSVAAGGVDCVPGEHILVADTAEQQAAALVTIMLDPTRRSRLAAVARERMLSHHTWSSSMRTLDAILQNHLGR